MTSISKCAACPFWGNGNYCGAINCPTFLIRKHGEILDFGHFLKFVPKLDSRFQPVVFSGKTYREVEDFLYNMLVNL